MSVEVMPLITVPSHSRSMSCPHCGEEFGVEDYAEADHIEQRDADLKVLEAKIVWMENAWRDYVEAQKKEWAKDEADWLENFVENLPDSVLTIRESNLFDAHIAQLREIAGGK